MPTTVEEVEKLSWGQLLYFNYEALKVAPWASLSPSWPRSASRSRVPHDPDSARSATSIRHPRMSLTSSSSDL